ncbi:hypothetical protein NCC78_08880 [Micromonospora phytophila]|nr:hypothetical protein [Micromonospora phytophila]
MRRTRGSAQESRTKEQSERGRRLDLQTTAIVLVVILQATAIVIDVTGFFDRSPAAGPAVRPSPSDQFKYQATVQDGRRDLFDGELHVTTDRTVKVAEWFDVRVLVCGPANSDELCLAPMEPTTPGVQLHRPSTSKTVPIGGRVGVILTSPHSEIEIKDDLNPAGSVQPLTDPTDAASWWWSVRASKPGTYDLKGAVFVLAADTDLELVTRDTFTIRLTVERTSEYTAKQVWTTTLDVTKWSVTQIIAVLTALIGAGAFAAWIRRRLR